MKRVLAFILIAIATVSTALAASGGAGKNVKWELKNGVLTFSGHGPMKNFGKDLPYRTDLVKQLIIQEGVTSVGNNVCRDCTDLITAELPSTITSIGDNAFYNCKNLSDVVIPFGVESVGDCAFKGCESLIEIEFPISTKTIGNEVCAGCENLTSARLTQSVETLGRDAFEGCKLLTTLNDLPPFITVKSFASYGLNRAAVKKFWDRKEEIAAKFGNASGSAAAAAPASTAAALEPCDVDTDIPYTGRTNSTTFALIIANENYGKLSNVPFAINDGNTFARYCQRTLGLPKQNILQYNDASYGSIREALSDLRLINEAVGENMRLIVYYAGHGAPDDATLEPYLIPVDAARINKDVCISMNSFYQEIGALKLRNATVFLDACFSGAARDGNMVIAARGIARVPKKQSLTGKIAVLAATSDEQTALPYNEKGHGMFTYYLLKRLQETKGDVSLQDLKDYVTDQVKVNSSIINRKDQTPTFNVSAEASSVWDSWKLND